MITGLDVSAHQESTPALAGFDFLIARAAYGSHLDARFPLHVAAARARGLVVGGYLFGRSVEDVGDQVAELLGAVDAIGGVDLVALDVERDGSNPAMTERQGRAFIAAVQAAGRRIGLYHSTSGYPADAWGADWRWVADYRPIDEPPIPWDVWQKRGSPLDIDVFRGTADQLRILGGGTVQAAITDEREQIVTVAAGVPWYDVDGRTVVGRTAAAGLGARRSPYGAAGRRAIFASVSGTRRLVLVRPTTSVDPAPPVVDCDDAVTHELEAAADRAAAAVRTRP